MQEAYYPGVTELLERQRLKRTAAWLVLSLVVTVIFSTVGVCLYFTQMPLIAAFAVGLVLMVCVSIPVVIWRDPRIGFYMSLLSVFLFGGASGISHATMPSGYIQYWRNISSIGQSYGSSALNGLAFSPAELIVMITTIAWLIRTISDRRFRFERGAFFLPIVVYIGFVFAGWLHGRLTGGDST